MRRYLHIAPLKHVVLSYSVGSSHAKFTLEYSMLLRMRYISFHFNSISFNFILFDLISFQIFMEEILSALKLIFKGPSI